MENECEALPGVAYPGVRDNRCTLNTKTGYDDERTRAILIGVISNDLERTTLSDFQKF